MTEKPEESKPTSIQRIAALLGLPEPEPWTEEEEHAFQKWMDDADAELRASLARRQERPAA